MRCKSMLLSMFAFHGFREVLDYWRKWSVAGLGDMITWMDSIA